MRLYEYEAKRLLAAYGIPLPQGQVISSPEEIAGDARRVLKVQVLSGGRMKAGGVKFADTEAEARAIAADLLGRTILNHKVEKLLVEERLQVEQEFFAAATHNLAQKQPVVLFSAAGGVDIETLAKERPEAVVSRAYNPRVGFHDFHARQMVGKAGLSGRPLMQLGAILHRLATLFQRMDATIAEINPIVQTADGRFLAADAHIDIEDDALSRHAELQEKYGIPKREAGARPPTPFELAAAAIDASDHRGVAGRMIEFDGQLGLLIGGGGASLTVFDAIRKHGGKPANYCEIGGNPSVRKVQRLVAHLLSKPGVEKIAVIMNVVSNTRVDLVARGVIKAIVERGEKPAEKIAIFRIPGSYEGDGFMILKKYGVTYCDRTVSIDEAARRAVAAFAAA
ncbi:MAG: acetate--CoA ligase family protein [Candidatus Tectomicrobia bacterium]|nr:acetate--CoA ligase family protein [Candidatus Tectomicrobia bacterium]